MTNLEVAKAMVGNAIAYGKSGDLQTVMVNLAYIETLLEEPNKKNPDHDWEDKRCLTILIGARINIIW